MPVPWCLTAGQQLTHHPHEHPRCASTASLGPGRRPSHCEVHSAGPAQRTALPAILGLRLRLGLHALAAHVQHLQLLHARGTPLSLAPVQARALSAPQPAWARTWKQGGWHGGRPPYGQEGEEMGGTAPEHCTNCPGPLPGRSERARGRAFILALWYSEEIWCLRRDSLSGLAPASARRRAS